MAEELLAKYKKDISRLTLVPSDGGCFEVSVDGQLVFSKLQQGRFPELEEVESQLARTNI